MTERMAKFGYPALVLLLSVLVFAVLSFNKRQPEARVESSAGVLVQTVGAETGDRTITIVGHGNVQPRQQARLSTEVRGKVSWLARSMAEGGFFRAGEEMFKLEQRDYQLAAQIASSEVARAEKDLEIARASSTIAAQEWETMKDLSAVLPKLGTSNKNDQPNSLVMQEPQLKSAIAQLEAARARLGQAELDLERTTIRAPFNCFVQEKQFDLGQYVTVGENVTTVVGSDVVELSVPLQLSEKQWIQKGLAESNGQPLEATVSVELGTKTLNWPAMLVRILADVDPRGRMHRAIVAVENPYFEDAEQLKPRGIALSVGMFAKAEITSAKITNVVAIPRRALRLNNLVWVVAGDNSLAIRPVELQHLTATEALVSSGVAAGEQVILTNIPGAVAGMKLRLHDDGEDQKDAAEPETL